MIWLKLSKNNRPRFTVKGAIATGVVIAIAVITINSFANGGSVEVLEKVNPSSPFYGIGKHLNNVVTGIGGFFEDIVNFRSNSNKVKELTDENKRLRQEIIDLKGDESRHDSLDRLKKSLNYIDGNQRNELVSASIIGKNDGDWYKSFIVEAGSDRGITKNSIVINGDGVVGIIYEVGSKYSKAISLVDSRASVSFKISGKENEKGVITTSSAVGVSDLKDIDKLLQGYLFDVKSKVKVGDLVVTSGLGFYPENIPVGKVSKVIYDKNKSMKFVKIRPNVDFKKLDEVSIIPPRKIE